MVSFLTRLWKHIHEAIQYGHTILVCLYITCDIVAYLTTAL